MGIWEVGVQAGIDSYLREAKNCATWLPLTMPFQLASVHQMTYLSFWCLWWPWLPTSMDCVPGMSLGVRISAVATSALFLISWSTAPKPTSSCYLQCYSPALLVCLVLTLPANNHNLDCESWAPMLGSHCWVPRLPLKDIIYECEGCSLFTNVFLNMKL